jgi:GlpG protein
MTDPNPTTAVPDTLAQTVKHAPVTMLLIAVSVVVGLVSQLGADRTVLTWLTVADLRGFDHTILGGFAAILQGQLWRLVTPIFIHFGFVHILFNMMWMYDLGPAIERRWSSRTLAVLTLVAAVLSNLTQYMVNWDLKTGVHYANALSGGMSGVVYALLGYLWIRGLVDPAAGIRIRPQVVLWMVGWLVLCMTGALGAIGNSAHGVGLLTGAACGWLAGRRPAGE